MSAVTVAFSCYNQRRFVEAALRSVLAQDVDDLQVVIWDDASTDGTTQIVRGIIDAYEGPFELVPVLNDVNRLAFEFDEVMARSDGDLVVIAHGDDVSLPNRVGRLTDAWQTHGVSVLTSNAWMIDEDDEVFGVWADPNVEHDMTFEGFLRQGYLRATIGAGMAIERALWEDFGPKKDSFVQYDVDGPLTFMGLLANGVYLDRECTLRYRVHRGQRSPWSRATFVGVEQQLEQQEQQAANQIANLTGFLDLLDEHEARCPDDGRVPEIRSGLQQLLVKNTRALSRVRLMR